MRRRFGIDFSNPVLASLTHVGLPAELVVLQTGWGCGNLYGVIAVLEGATHAYSTPQI